MSNRRRSPVANRYRTDFLHSLAWFARRDRWFRTQTSRGPLVCAACLTPATEDQLELHHVDYSGVTFVDGSWRAFEPHQALIPLHRECHEHLHRILDRDRLLARHRTREDATRTALTLLHGALPEGTP